MTCHYCGLALTADDVGTFHKSCATEASTDPLIDTTLRHCDLPCCNPEEDR